MSTYNRRLGDGRVFANSGDLRRALEAYSDALGAASGDQERSRALGGLGVVKDRLGDVAGLADLEEAVRLGRAADSEQLGQRLHDLGLCRVRAGREAIALLEESWPLAQEDRQRMATVEVLGQACLDAGQFRMAESAFLQQLALAQLAEVPDAAIRAHNGRGEALRRGGRLQEAMLCFQKVIEVLGPLKTPTESQREQAGVALHNLGVLLLEERPDAARTMLQQAIQCFVAAFGSQQHPHVARSTAFLGRLALLEGDASGAEAQFKEALRLVPLGHPIAQELVPALRRSA